MDAVIEYIKVALIIFVIGVFLIIVGRASRKEKKYSTIETIGYYVCLIGVFHGLILYFLEGILEVINYFVFGTGVIISVVILIIYLQNKK